MLADDPVEGHHVNDLEAAADQAELPGQMRSFMTWLGEGRKLTQTGRIGLAGACPPEDSGGAYGFEGLKELLAGPPSAERDEMRDWAGDFDPARFDLAAANAAAAET
jgi:hypothetical protein